MKDRHQSGNPHSAGLPFIVTDQTGRRMKRRLAAILVADVAGYSSLMEADEEAARMVACRAIADPEIVRADGRGLHLADVLVEGDDLIGLAARIQQAADPGAIDLSGAMFEQIRRTSPYAFEDRGEPEVPQHGRAGASLSFAGRAPGRAEAVLAWKPKYSDLHTIVETAWPWYERDSNHVTNAAAALDA
jgi:class 3 adenylate cyclase